MYKITLLGLTVIFVLLTFKNSFSKGDLTRQKAVEVEINLKGKSGKVHFYEPSTIKFKTGKLYKLKIVNLSDSKHYFTSEKFSNSIFTRKIQISKKNNKIAEVKGIIKEVEVFPITLLNGGSFLYKPENLMTYFVKLLIK